VLLATMGLLARDTVTALAARCVGATPLVIGLGPERQALVDALVQHTAPDERILWEDRPASREASRWTALLPLLTRRDFIGGLDPDAVIEHTRAGLVEQTLEGKLHIAKVTDDDLKGYCHRYNVGWVVCWSPAAIARFRAWTAGATEVAQLADQGTGCLFRIRRPTTGLALKGHAQLLHADAHHITLADVVPDNGIVVLSLHYQAGMRAAPGRVVVERAPWDKNDLVPFVRLRVASPAARVTLTWEDRQ
jgi:hypothetical protein